MIVKDRLNEIILREVDGNYVVDELIIFNPSEYIKNDIELSVISKEEQVKKIIKVAYVTLNSIKESNKPILVPIRDKNKKNISFCMIFWDNFNDVAIKTTMNIGDNIYTKMFFINMNSFIAESFYDNISKKEVDDYLNREYKERML